MVEQGSGQCKHYSKLAVIFKLVCCTSKFIGQHTTEDCFNLMSNSLHIVLRWSGATPHQHMALSVIDTLKFVMPKEKQDTLKHLYTK